MIRRSILWLVIVMMLTGAGLVRAIAKNGVTNEKQKILQMFKQREKRIKALLDASMSSEAQRERLKEEINGIFDFESMAAIALGHRWETLTPKQRREFVDAFASLIRENSLRKLDIYRAEIEYLDVEMKDDQARLKTRATYKDKQTTIDYELIRKNGRWYVIDFLLDDVSTARAYQKSFARIMKKHGYTGLLERIRRKVASLRKRHQKKEGSAS